jgi:hypothetical protein
MYDRTAAKSMHSFANEDGVSPCALGALGIYYLSAKFVISKQLREIWAGRRKQSMYGDVA